ncbi:unnamed protein product [Onchocerca ochengi]|uniref:Histone domain-containing protein n=1 Tax=Onchocerca ochengi TaxID=42157 RepID=A0A182EUK9_ONCOC|nr:unnamed protein product [Onchocerca ochengi]
MGKKKKRTVRKGKFKQHARLQSVTHPTATRYTTAKRKAVSSNCKLSHMSQAEIVLYFSFPAFFISCNKPIVEEIMDIRRASELTMDNFQNSLQLLNILVENYEPAIDKICYEGLEFLVPRAGTISPA